MKHQNLKQKNVLNLLNPLLCLTILLFVWLSPPLEKNQGKVLHQKHVHAVISKIAY